MSVFLLLLLFFCQELLSQLYQQPRFLIIHWMCLLTRVYQTWNNFYGLSPNMDQRVKDIINLNILSTISFISICKFWRENEYTKKETAKFQGSIFHQNKALWFWNWQNEQQENEQQKQNSNRNIFLKDNHAAITPSFLTTWRIPSNVFGIKWSKTGTNRYVWSQHHSIIKKNKNDFGQNFTAVPLGGVVGGVPLVLNQNNRLWTRPPVTRRQCGLPLGWQITMSALARRL